MVLIVLLCTFTAVGSLFPQIPTGVGQDQWLDIVRDRYGPIADLWHQLGVFSFASSPGYLIVASMSVVATTVCLYARWKTLWRAAMVRQSPNDGRTKASLSITCVLDPSAKSGELERSLTKVLEKKRFRVRAETADSALHLRADRYQWAWLGSLGTHVAVPLFAIAVLLSSCLGERYDLAIEPNAQTLIGPTTDVMLRNDGFFLIEDHAGQMVAYEALLALVEDGREIGSRRLRVNRPLRVGGYSVYLNSYWQSTEGYGVALIAARDPGYGLFVVAGLLAFLGTILSFWVVPITLWFRMDENGVIVYARSSRSGAIGREELVSLFALVGLDSKADLKVDEQVSLR